MPYCHRPLHVKIVLPIHLYMYVDLHIPVPCICYSCSRTVLRFHSLHRPKPKLLMSFP